MILVCVRPFGYRKPGDEVEVPDDSGFDPFHFTKKAPPKPSKSTSNVQGSK